jgi:1-acyl-sn-glycerol-3-phosphate acyltransferase
MLAGAIILTILGSSLRSEVAISWSLMGIGLSIGLLSLLTFVGISPVIKYHVGGLAIIFAGVFAAGTMASYNALMQRILPNRLRGRVFGLTDLCTMTGLLLTTGLIGIPHWGNIDAWIGYILLGVTLIVVGAGLASILVRLSHGRLPARKLFWWNLNEFYCKFWFRLRREGICTVPGEGRAIVVANHTCSIDPLLLTACAPWRLIGFMVAKEFYAIPIAKHLIRMLECIPVRRDGTDTAATKQALRHLKEEKVLGIFIEGRITSPEDDKTLKEGAAMLAARTGTVIVPAHISGTHYSTKVMPPFFRRHRAVVRYGKPIDVKTLFSSDRPSREELRQATNVIFARIQELGEKGE